MKTSSIKLDQFSESPGADAAKQYLLHNLPPNLRVVDLDDSYSFYANAHDTLVLAIPKGPTEKVAALGIGQMAVHFAADEFTWEIIEAATIVRLWWD